MDSYEKFGMERLNLSDVLVKMQDVYAYSAYLASSSEQYDDLATDMEHLILKLQLLSIIKERFVIGVSGFQGAGKSTMLNTFLFDEPLKSNASWFPQDVGVGENLPILVTIDSSNQHVTAKLLVLEKEQQEFSYTKRTFIRNQVVETPQEAREKCSNPESNYLLLEVSVPLPERLSDDGMSAYYLDKSSFLLLPGYEEEHEDMSTEKRFRQDYMKLALSACTSSILVINPTTIMKGNHEKALKTIQAEFDSKKIVYALSHADSAENIDDAEDALHQNYGVKRSRIIKTGTENEIFNRSKVDAWRRVLVRTLREIASVPDYLRQSQTKNIEKLIKECNKVLRKISALNNRTEITDESEKSKIKELLKPYDEQVSEIVSSFIQFYESEISEVLRKTYEELHDETYDSSAGTKIGDWFAEKFFGPEPPHRFREVFKEKMEKHLENAGGQNLIGLRSVNKTQNQLGIYQDLMVEGNDQKLLKENALEHVESTNTAFKIDEPTIRNIQFLVGYEKLHSMSSKTAEPDQNFKQAIKIIPSMLMEMQRFELAKGKELDYEGILIKPETAEKNITAYFNTSTDSIKGFAAAISSLIGLDYLPDGKLDGIGGIIASLFPSATATAAAGEAAVGTKVAAAGMSTGAALATGVVIAAVVAWGVHQAAIDHSLRKVAVYSQLQASMQTILVANMRKELEAMFERIRNLILARLEKYAFNNSNAGNFIKLSHSIEQANLANRNLIEEIRIK